jgi:two-component system, chemotaxis family, response regulator Rcp1
MIRVINILVVEDNEGDIRLVREALKQAKIPCRIGIARDGVAAIENLRQGARPDLILLDLNLPRKDGREVLREIKQDPELQHIPVLVLTSSRAQEDIVNAYRLHANCYLAKPSRLDDYFSLLAAIEEFWTRVAHLPIVPSEQ